jgi:hypothetical protein
MAAMFATLWAPGRYSRGSSGGDWQRDNRGQEDDGGFSAYVEQRKLATKREFVVNEYTKELAKIEANPVN